VIEKKKLGFNSTGKCGKNTQEYISKQQKKALNKQGLI